MRGLDNSTYYELGVNGQGAVNADYYGANGAGPDYNTYNHAAQNLIVDSLYYWSATMGVDGFRFDEGPMLGNVCESDQPSPQTPNCPAGTGFHFSASDAKTALARILSEPLLATRPAVGGSGLDLIAEPNAVGCSSCDNAAQQGNFPTGFSEWNFNYKEVLPMAQNKLGVVTITPGAVADAYTGSASLFQGASHNNRNPWNSVNYMDSHDGVTLNDLYSCNSPNNNQGYPFGPSDGGSDDVSWDQDNPSTGQPAAQRRAARTGLAFVMLSAGTPMIQAGDEYLRTLACNDNPYNVDSVGTWLTPAVELDLGPKQLQHLCDQGHRLPQGSPFAAAGHLVHAGAGGLVLQQRRPGLPGPDPEQLLERQQQLSRLHDQWRRFRRFHPVRHL